MVMDSKPLTANATTIPHVLMFPLPIQSSINSMLKLSEMLCLSGLHVTFLNTEHNHERLVRCTNTEPRLKQYHGFCFETISDGLPEENLRSAEQFQEMIVSLQAMAEPYLRERLSSTHVSGPPVTCLIVDNLLYYAADIAYEIGIPVFHFETISPSCLWIYFCTPNIIEAGEFRYEGVDLSRLVTSVPGMEGLLRMCDLPYLGPGDYTNNPNWQAALLDVQRLPRANGLILNTFDDLDGLSLNRLRSSCPNLYCIGPIHQLYKNAVHDAAEKIPSRTAYSNNLWEEDKTCLTWLDEQKPKSVIFVSLGSLSVMRKDEFMELLHGLVNSGVKFLWAIRPGSLVGGVPNHHKFLKEEENGRSCIVGWVPQEQVLAHPSIGGYLSHGGWVSTLEGIVEGVPMICWAQYVDHLVISRLVSEVWKIGLDMKGTSLDREIVENMVRELMITKKEEFQKSIKILSELARGAISEAGSSYCDMQRLVNDIKVFSLRASMATENSDFN